MLSCPSQYLLSGLRSARPHHVQVETGAFVDPMWEPCVRSPQTCDRTVFSGAVFSGLLSFSLSFSLLFSRLLSQLCTICSHKTSCRTQGMDKRSQTWWRGAEEL